MALGLEAGTATSRPSGLDMYADRMIGFRMPFCPRARNLLTQRIGDMAFRTRAHGILLPKVRSSQQRPMHNWAIIRILCTDHFSGVPLRPSLLCPRMKGLFHPNTAKTHLRAEPRTLNFGLVPAVPIGQGGRRLKHVEP